MRIFQRSGKKHAKTRIFQRKLIEILSDLDTPVRTPPETALKCVFFNVGEKNTLKRVFFNVNRNFEALKKVEAPAAEKIVKKRVFLRVSLFHF